MAGRQTSDNPATFIRSTLAQDSRGPWRHARAEVVKGIHIGMKNAETWAALAHLLGIHPRTLDNLRADFPKDFEP